MVKALQAMYSVVKSCVRYNSNTSRYFESNIGVKQGDPSSSLMFLFFVNDIINNINADIAGIFTANEIKILVCKQIQKRLRLIRKHNRPN